MMSILNCVNAIHSGLPIKSKNCVGFRQCLTPFGKQFLKSISVLIANHDVYVADVYGVFGNGINLSIGARGNDILLQFLIEAVIISITGGLIGAALGIAASLIVSSTLHWPIIISQTSIVISFIVCAFTGVFFGYYPALKAARLDPIEALRYE